MNMGRWRYGLIGLGLLLGVAAAVGLYIRWTRPHSVPAAGGPTAHGLSPAGERKVLYWYDPMHPWIRSDKPGKAPDCGMDLVPKYADEAAAGTAPGTVLVTPARQQLIGIRTGPVVRRRAVRTWRTVGIVVVDETLIHHIHTRISGWVRQVYINFSGQFVRKGDRILEIYSPDVLATEQEYLLALRLRDDLREADPPARQAVEQMARDALQRMRLWDISSDEIERLERTRRPAEVVPIRADMTGYVLELNVRHGMYVTPEMEIYKIADLRRVWVQAVAYEGDLASVTPGMPARITLRDLLDRAWDATVDYVYPDVDPQTRTVQVRLTVSNPDYVLKPGMYVDVELRQVLGERLVVPAEAVIDTGVQQYVFVVRGEGTFEPRPVRTGERVEEGYVVREGLREGDVVVTSANFLIDSESQLQTALETLGPHGLHGAGAVPSPEPSQVVEIRVTERGFEPASVRVPAGRPVTLRFVRVTENTCATSVYIPDWKVRRELPLNQAVDVPVQADRPGRVRFACGMNMLEGTITVEEGHDRPHH